VKKSLFDMARSLLNLYASRQLIQGWKFTTDSPVQHKFEQLFPYQETEDQLQAIEDVKKDMESSKPMDRLIVGDVGFGKTEVALRAAFKAAIEGKQTAIIAPTTVLAYQHHRNFKFRLEGFPFKAAMLSRLVERKDQKKIIESVEKGEIDIIIGTHRLLSNDVKFHNLGLLVIDEEQRFGVNHKEKIKMLKHQVDVITLTATPIPRTLNLAMMGVRDLSLIETPPENRLSVKTEIVPFDNDILAEALSRELSRGGQVYFVHNRVDNIETIRDKITEMSPKARILIAHGQMEERQLEKVMLGFISGEADILLSTTIIENGIDIPNVNTLIVNNAHKFGLAQLYQLRGRVGRSERQAYCYFVVPEYSALSPEARTRLQTLIEFSRLGSGFRIAAIDMELRGSGNILGDEQSGHISEVGFDLYCRMLEEAVSELKGEVPKGEVLKPSIELQANIAVPESYIPQTDQRLALYRQISSAETEEELERIKKEAIDRYGKPPKVFFRLMDYGWLRVQAWKYAISKISRDADKIRFKIEKNTPLGPKNIYNFCSRWVNANFLPDGQLVVPLNKDDALKTARIAIETLIETRL
jgi:transcription-repair coupling factor (superfamily II helicase)